MTDLSNRNRGIYGSHYDRYVERYDDSTLSRMKQQYWEAKQTFIRKLRRKEDDCIVASDAELDAKLELCRTIEESCQNLITILEGFQDHVCGLAHEESATGRFLKECGKMDKTRAGKMMTATGKTLSYTAQQRIQLRNPLVRLYQEVETFQFRAVVDTFMTIDKMEKSRTAYRGALLWMKDVSQQLDPDTYKQLEKFRKVQSHVRRTKTRFDRMKLDTLQKIDLLSASRCNMYSHALVGYQNALLQFWEKTSRTMNAVAESFKGYQHYEFNMLKELTETSKKLSEETSSCDDDIRKIFEDDDNDDKDRLIFFDAEYHDNDLQKKNSKKDTKKSKTHAKRDARASHAASKDTNSTDLFDTKKQSNESTLLDFGAFQSADHSMNVKPNENKIRIQDILTVSDADADDYTILNEILNAPTTPVIDATHLNQSSSTKSDVFKMMMPSQLLDLSGLQLNSDTSSMVKEEKSRQMPSTNKVNKSMEKGKPDMSPWFSLFADLDPLANPDDIGKKSNYIDDRNC